MPILPLEERTALDPEDFLQAFLLQNHPVIMRGAIAHWTQSVFVLPSSEAGNDKVQAGLAVVSPGFFQTLGISLLEGRDVDWKDTSQQPRAALVSRRLSQRLFHSQILLGDGSASATIRDGRIFKLWA